MTVYGSRSGVLSIPRGDPDFALVGAGPYTAHYTYTPDDLPQTMAYPNGVNVALGYDANSQLTSLTALGPPNQVPATTTPTSGYAYGYNAAGWITGTTTLSGTDTITHDASGRLTDECGPQMVTPDHCGHWTYDKNGNLLTAIGDAGVTDVYTYSVTGPGGQINEQVAGGSSTSPITAAIAVGYDGHGDTTSISNPVALTDPTSAGYKKYALNESFGYDAEQRPILATRLESTKVGTATIVTPLTATIQYNADGLRSDYLLSPDPRTGKAPVDTHFAYRDGELASATVTDNTGALLYKNTFIYGPSGEPLELIRTDPTSTRRFWYVLDGLGSVVALTDQNGKVVDRYAYDSWGEPTSDDRVNETVPQQLRYAGYYYDEALTYYWVTTRYYDPEGMRWFQPDPSDQDGVRTYVYVGDDPVDSFDLTGLYPEPPFFHAPSAGARPLFPPPLALFPYTVSYGPIRGNTNFGGGFKGVGTSVTAALKPPEGYTPGTPGASKAIPKLPPLVKGHLLAKVLSGSNTNPQNFVPLYRRVNDPGMKKYELYVRDLIKGGDVVLYTVQAHFIGVSDIPRYIEIAADSYKLGGVIFHVCIKNTRAYTPVITDAYLNTFGGCP